MADANAPSLVAIHTIAVAMIGTAIASARRLLARGERYIFAVIGAKVIHN